VKWAVRRNEWGGSMAGRRERIELCAGREGMGVLGDTRGGGQGISGCVGMTSACVLSGAYVRPRTGQKGRQGFFKGVS